MTLFHILDGWKRSINRACLVRRASLRMLGRTVQIMALTLRSRLSLIKRKISLNVESSNPKRYRYYIIYIILYRTPHDKNSTIIWLQFPYIQRFNEVPSKSASSNPTVSTHINWLTSFHLIRSSGSCSSSLMVYISHLTVIRSLPFPDEAALLVHLLIVELFPVPVEPTHITQLRTFVVATVLGGCFASESLSAQ